MSSILLETVKYVKNKTGANLRTVKDALTKSKNDTDLAIEIITNNKSFKSLSGTNNKSVFSVIYPEEHVGYLIEINYGTSRYNAQTLEKINKYISEIIKNEAVASNNWDINTNAVLRTLASKYNVQCPLELKVFKIKKQSELSLLSAYNDPESKISVLLETIAEDEEMISSRLFKEFSFDCCLQIAALNALAISSDNVSRDSFEKLIKSSEEKLFLTNIPVKEWNKNITKDIADWNKKHLLLNQPFIKNKDITISKLKEIVETMLRGKIEISKFIRVSFLD